MCDPMTAMAIVGTVGPKVVDGVSAVLDHAAQQQKHDENKKNSLDALRETFADINARDEEEQRTGAQSILQISRQAAQADASSRVAAGEAGVAGASVTALLQGIERDAAGAQQGVRDNLSMVRGQLSREARGAQRQAENRISAVPAPNPFLTGLRILGAGASATGDVLRIMPKSGGG